MNFVLFVGNQYSLNSLFSFFPSSTTKSWEKQCVWYRFRHWTWQHRRGDEGWPR